MTGNDVTYEYDTNGNGRGRLWRITDGSGSYECHYDALGNVTDETRTIALPQHSEVYQFSMLYQYDSWGRMLTMTYPDNEEITYTYQWGGDLRSMHGVKDSNHRTYIREIRYNPFGQKKQVNYGNGTQAQYSYDALHRLAHLRSFDSLGNLMQDIDYTFDNASNVTRIVNNAGVVNTLGGAYENTYNYDVLHRLKESYGGGAIGNYNTYLTYSPSGRLIGKLRDNNSVTLSATVDMAYGYCDDYQPHAVKRMFDYNDGMLYDMRWDEAGNLGQVSMGRLDEMFDAGRFLFWTEDNRMHAAVDDRYYSYYAYDHSGGSCGSREQSQACLSYAEMEQRRRSQRRLKLVGDNCSMDVNAEYMNASSALNEPTLYPSAYMVLTNKGYTKHYYAGTERVAARLGGGGLNAQYHVIDNDDGLQTKADMLFGQSLEQVNSRVLNENNLDCIINNEFAIEEFGHWIDGIPYQMKAEVEFDYGRFNEMVNSMLTDYHNGKEEEVYFYHSDHLGSASWITDSIGIPIQHLQYLPYGEPYVDQRHAGATYSERFRFTGKERDEETGFGYFGARYMDHELMTMWLSVDPMADKYPGISPYNYCVWNPIKLVDPDGNEAWKPDENRNLVAEKGDNAWTLATYLNTTPEIATNMLEEQGYSVNAKGVLNLREGDVFEIDHGTIEAHSDNDLGKTGNFIRQKAGSGIAKDLFTNFWNGEGDITLTGSQFAGILMYIKESNQSPTESDSKSKLINFYDSQEYSLAFGSATVTLDGKQRITGFKDTYDFDPKKLGQRSLNNEIQTRAVAAASNIIGNGKKFKVSYP